MNAQHTPTPWVVSDNFYRDAIKGPNGETVAQFAMPSHAADRDFIVLACNSYNTLVQQRDELVRVLEAVDAWVATRKGVVMPYALETMARAALSRIKGESK